jgi:undecaprenyl-diphosphatase
MNQLVVFVAQYVVFLLPLLLLVVFMRLSKDDRWSLLIALTVGGVLSLVGIFVASHLFYDPRPFVSGAVVPLFQHSADNGFPSDHTTIGATLAFIGYIYSKKVGLVMISLAVAVGVARVLAHVHSWIDILGGILVALLATMLAVYASRYIAEKWIPSQHIKNETRRKHV